MQLQDSYWLWWSKQNKTLQNNTSDSKADFQQLEYNGKNHELSQSKAAHSNLNHNIATVTVTPRPVVIICCSDQLRNHLSRLLSLSNLF